MYHVSKDGVYVGSFVKDEHAYLLARMISGYVQKIEDVEIELDEEKKHGELIGDKNSPYLTFHYNETVKLYNPDYGDDRMCKCGHPYSRHFDPYEDNRAVGCKYCDCYEFVEAEPEVKGEEGEKKEEEEKDAQ